MIASEAGEGSGGARSANTVAQSAVGRRVAHTIDFPDTIGVREVRTHVLIFSVAIFTHGDLFAFKGARCLRLRLDASVVIVALTCVCILIYK